MARLTRTQFKTLIPDATITSWVKYAYIGFQTLPEGYAKVDLGTLTWNKYTSGENWLFYATVTNGKTYGGVEDIPADYYIAGTNYTINMITKGGQGACAGADKNTYWDKTNPQILIKDLSYSDAAAFKTAMNGKTLIYKKVN